MTTRNNEGRSRHRSLRSHNVTVGILGHRGPVAEAVYPLGLRGIGNKVIPSIRAEG